MAIVGALKDAEYESVIQIIIMENCPKVISMELQEAHMHIRKAMKILQIQRRME